LAFTFEVKYRETKAKRFQVPLNRSR